MTRPLLAQHLAGRRGVVVVGVDPEGQPALAAGRLRLAGAAALPGVLAGLRQGGRIPVVDLDGCPPAVVGALAGPAFTTDPELARRALAAGRRVLAPTWTQDVPELTGVALRSGAVLFAPARLLDAEPPVPVGEGELRLLGRRAQVTLVAAGPSVEQAVAVARMLTGRGVVVGAGACADVPAAAPGLLEGGLAVLLDEDPASGAAGWRAVETSAGTTPRDAMEAVLAALPLGSLTDERAG